MPSDTTFELCHALGSRITSLRKSAGLSQSALAERVGVTRQAVSLWELGNSMPDLDRLLRMSQVFQVSTDFLLTGKEPSAKASRQAGGRALALVCLVLCVLSVLGICILLFYMNVPLPANTPPRSLLNSPYCYLFFPLFLFALASGIGFLRCRSLS